MCTHGREWFPGVDKIEYEGPASRNPRAFRYYNPDEVIEGKVCARAPRFKVFDSSRAQTMREWLRFSVCFWHTFRYQGTDMFGDPTIQRPWSAASTAMEDAKCRADAAFELFRKLGVDYYTFHDTDVVAPGRDLAETSARLDEMAEHLLALQDAHGVRPLWATANLFSHPVYANGAATNPDLHVFARAGAQVRKCMEVGHRLQAAGFVVWGGREGYQTALNTDVARELRQLVAFLQMVAAHKRELGATFQLLLEPKPCEPLRHMYMFDAATTAGLLARAGLTGEFKLNIEPNHTTLAGHAHAHDVLMARVLGLLGSIDANTGDELLGWDTDQFPSDAANATRIMLEVMEQGGLGAGGLNFDAKVRRESTDLEDIVIAHVAAMDTYARGLRAAARLRADGALPAMREHRYASWRAGLGARVLDPAGDGPVSLRDLHEYVEDHGEPHVRSAKQELFERHLADYL